jgi:2-keto-4-pentenoate hydratase/2-oxohepta-3-ene-1,7-dioic acid hydratase in catechol pathway
MKYGRLTDGRFVELDGEDAVVLDAAPWRGGARTVSRVSKPQLGIAVAPSKIICIGRNYRSHAKELGNEVPKEPLLFFKPPSSLLASGGTVVLPPESKQVDYEAELGVVVGKRLRRADEAAAAEAIFGLIAVCDVTARDIQRSDNQWTRGKGFDTFCPVGPYILKSDAWLGKDVICRVDGVEKQRGNTSDLVFSVPALLAYISQCMTLEPGDLVVTGTPEGVGPLSPGQTVEVDVPGVSLLSVSVTA